MPALNICLVSPVPPPYGGISNGTRLMYRYAAKHSRVRFLQINTAVHWRSVHDLAICKRVVGGGLQMLKDYIPFLKTLLKQPHLVHLKTSGQLAIVRDLLFSATARLFRIPLTYQLHFGRVPEIAAGKTFEWLLLTLVFRMASVVMAVDRPTEKTIRALPYVRVEYTPNAIDLSDLPTVEENQGNVRKVLFLGWVIPTKGVGELVQAWSELALEGWELWLAGPFDPAYEAELLQHYQPVGLKFLGELGHDAAMELVARCDVFVLPSHTEGFPHAVLEAMAMARPIIATAVGAIPDMLSGGCGLLLEPKNVAELKAALLLFTHDRQLGRECGANARRRVEEVYSLDAAFARYLQIWMNILPEESRDAVNGH